jgi:predicted GNAT family acetyltransferase
MSVTVKDNVAKSRYEIFDDGELGGFEDYELSDGVISFIHAEIDATFAGRNLAPQLVVRMLDDARERGLGVLPFCSYVEKFVREHRKECLDLVPVAERANFNL